MLVVTTNEMPGHEIQEVIGDVVVSLNRSVNPFKEGVKQLRGGGADPDAADNLTKWRTSLVSKLGEKAKKKGANAVVAMRFDSRQVGPLHMELCAYGTAVKVEPISSNGSKSEDKSSGQAGSSPPSGSSSGSSSGGG